MYQVITRNTPEPFEAAQCDQAIRFVTICATFEKSAESYFLTRGTNYTDTKLRFTNYFEVLYTKINDCMLQETLF